MVNQFTNKIVPLEKSFGYLYPEYVEYWHTDNIKTAYEVYAGTAKKYKMICELGHVYEMSPNHKKMGTRCYYCNSKKLLKGFNDLQTVYPDLAKRFSPLNGTTPDNVTARMKDKYYWNCSNGYDHACLDTITHMVNDNVICAVCAGKQIVVGFNDFKSLFPEEAKEWNYKRNGDMRPEDFPQGTNKKVWWVCEKGHEWEAAISNRSIGRGCHTCNRRNSNLENIIVKVLENNNYNVKHNLWIDLPWKKRSKMECDIVLPDNNIIIQYDGEYWHKDHDMDVKRANYLIDNGWIVINIRENNLESLNIISDKYYELWHKYSNKRNGNVPIGNKVLTTVNHVVKY